MVSLFGGAKTPPFLLLLRNRRLRIAEICCRDVDGALKCAATK